MNSNWKKFTPFAFYFSIAAALCSIAFWIVIPERKLPLQISLGFVILGIALIAFLDPDRVRRMFSGRQARYGSNLVILSFSTFGIIVVINFLGYQNPLRWDLTEDRVHSLSPETIDVLQSTNEPIFIDAFFTSRLSKTSTELLLDSYEYSGKENFAYRFIDPEANPLEAKKAKVTRDGTLVVRKGDQQELVTYPSEQDITSAIIRLTNPGNRNIYFLIGQGELDIENPGDTAVTDLRTVLENKNYIVGNLNLLNQQEIPGNALAIVIAGSKIAISEEVSTLLEAYLASGGSLVILNEPQALKDKVQNDYLNTYLSAEWGAAVMNDVIIDPEVNPPLVTIAQSYNQHAITEKLMNIATVFPTAHSILIDHQPENINLIPLITTSQVSWGETNFSDLKIGEVNFDKNEDNIGPLTIAVIAENLETTGRLVIIGDSDFASNKYFYEYGNADLIINSIDWAASQDNLITLTPKRITERFLVPPGQIVMGLILFGVIVFLPGLIIIAGLSAWISRKRRG